MESRQLVFANVFALSVPCVRKRVVLHCAVSWQNNAFVQTRMSNCVNICAFSEKLCKRSSTVAKPAPDYPAGIMFSNEHFAIGPPFRHFWCVTHVSCVVHVITSSDDNRNIIFISRYDHNYGIVNITLSSYRNDNITIVVISQ